MVYRHGGYFNERKQTMTRYELVAACIEDYMHGERHSLAGLIDWLHYDKQIPISRILAIAERLFSLPRKVTFNILKTLSEEYVTNE
jgi:hypothetical protein